MGGENKNKSPQIKTDMVSSLLSHGIEIGANSTPKTSIINNNFVFVCFCYEVGPELRTIVFITILIVFIG